jgi:transcriptional regulator with XRE-family HTH domain
MECSDSYHWPFPKRFRLLIDETRVSQQEIADHVGVSRQAISQWKNGVTIPDMYHFRKVADFFNVPMEYLLGETKSRLRENINAANDLGLSDKAITKLQNWANINRGWSGKVPLSEVLSDIIAHDDFDTFLEHIQRYITEHIENRLFEENEENKVYIDDHIAAAWTESDADNNARFIGMRAIKAKDLSVFYKYQAMEALERVLYMMPTDYYVAHKLKQEGKDDGEYSAEEE